MSGWVRKRETPKMKDSSANQVGIIVDGGVLKVAPVTFIIACINNTGKRYYIIGCKLITHAYSM